MKKHIGCGILLSLGLQVASAGTMGDVATYDFNGFYAGLGTGMLAMIANNSYTATTSSGFSTSGQPDWTDTSVLFDGHIGYGKMIQPRTYLGAKGSIFYTPLKHEYTTSFTKPTGATIVTHGNHIDSTSLKPIYSIDAVLGYEVTPHLMPFVEAGVNFANVNTNSYIARTLTNTASTFSAAYEINRAANSYKTGGNVGIGASYLASQHLFLSAEILYHYLGRTTINQTAVEPITGITDAFSFKTENQAVSLLASVSYLFPNS